MEDKSRRGIDGGVEEVVVSSLKELAQAVNIDSGRKYKVILSRKLGVKFQTRFIERENMPKLTIKSLCKEALIFSKIESHHTEPLLYGVTDGKAVGTYLEHKFREYLSDRYQFNLGNSAIGIDFPQLNVDIKVTSINQPQSSCPFKSARQKIYGLGYSLLIFVYQKVDNATDRTATLNILHTIFVNKDQTADFQTTSGVLNILANKGNKDDIMAFLYERNLPLDDIGIEKLADEIMKSPPKQGYLTISNALQWRLQYSRVIAYAGKEDGVISIHQAN